MPAPREKMTPGLFFAALKRRGSAGFSSYLFHQTIMTTPTTPSRSSTKIEPISDSDSDSDQPRNLINEVYNLSKANEKLEFTLRKYQSELFFKIRKLHVAKQKKKAWKRTCLEMQSLIPVSVLASHFGFHEEAEPNEEEFVLIQDEETPDSPTFNPYSPAYEPCTPLHPTFFDEEEPSKE